MKSIFNGLKKLSSNSRRLPAKVSAMLRQSPVKEEAVLAQPSRGRGKQLFTRAFHRGGKNSFQLILNSHKKLFSHGTSHTFIQRFNQSLFFEKNFKDTIGRTIESFSNELAENNCRPNGSGLREGLQNTPTKDAIPKLSSAICKNEGRTSSLQEVEVEKEKERCCKRKL